MDDLRICQRNPNCPMITASLDQKGIIFMHVYTDLPPDKEGHRGERALAKQLIGLGDDKAHYWFCLDYLPGVKDIDILLYHEIAGLFCIEVKSVFLNMLEEFDFQKCKIDGRGQDDGPNNQAYRAMETLMRYLGGNYRFAGIKLGFMKSTACWPKIAREEWKRSWDNSEIRRLSDRMLHSEDVMSGPHIFVERLKEISRNPPVRGGNNFTFNHKPHFLASLIEAMNERGRKIAAPSDLEKLRVIEEDVSKRTRQEVPLKECTRIMYSGYPGTGKTFKLLQIASYHARNGKNVLYACFNKTLAADIRRILSYSENLAKCENTPDVFDVWDMIRYYEKGNDDIDAKTLTEHHKLREDKKFDDAAAVLVGDMRKRNLRLSTYDTVLIDEAQDMKDWALEMLDMHAHTNSNICVAAGSGQELYGTSSLWLQIFLEDISIPEKHRPRQLKRNFRNTKPVFLVAQTAFSTNLERAKIPTFLKGKVKQPLGDEDQELYFDRPEGRLPAIVNIDENIERYAWHDDDQHSQRWDEHMVDEYGRIIAEQLSELKEDQRPFDILILVPNAKGKERDWSHKALERLGIVFMDYTVESRRRDIARPEMVRLCTYHSSRGLEGQRVVVFGLEDLDGLAKNTSAKPANLAYVVLSRSTFELIICVNRRIKNRVLPFVEATLAEIQRLT